MLKKPSSKPLNIKKIGVSMENHKIQKPKEEPRLSGAYIRTLVKHLSSTKIVSSVTQQDSPRSNPPQRKQVRRRRHATKPYQERLLNMAEARREIVTALKFHRASMKQRQTALPAGLSNIYQQQHYYSSLSCPPPPPPIIQENLDHFTLPIQPLGLNLNIQDFVNLDANLYNNPLSNYSTSSSSSSSSSLSASSAAISSVSEEMAAGMSEKAVATTSTAASSSSSSGTMTTDGGLHHALDEDGMEEMRSLVEQHEIEWNDTVSLLMSAKWFSILNNIETHQEEGKYDHVIDFPSCTDIGEIEEMDGEWLACNKQD